MCSPRRPALPLTSPSGRADTADPGQSLVDGAFRTADDALFSFIDPAAKALGMRGLDGAAVDAALVDAED